MYTVDDHVHVHVTCFIPGMVCYDTWLFFCRMLLKLKGMREGKSRAHRLVVKDRNVDKLLKVCVYPS